jgi:hypothetical protein
MLLSELANRLFLLMHLLWSVRIHQLVKGCCGLLPSRISFGVLISVTVLDGETLEFFSILLTRANYFLRVGSLTMHSFFICPATTLESVQRMHL